MSIKSSSSSSLVSDSQLIGACEEVERALQEEASDAQFITACEEVEREEVEEGSDEEMVREVMEWEDRLEGMGVDMGAYEKALKEGPEEVRELLGNVYRQRKKKWEDTWWKRIDGTCLNPIEEPCLGKQVEEDGSWGIVCETHQPEVWQRLRSEFQEEVASRLKPLVEEREKWEDKWWEEEEEEDVVEEGTIRPLEFETQPYVWEWDYFFPDEPCLMDEFGIPPWKPVEEDPPPSPPPRQPSLPLLTPEPPKIDDDDDEEDWQDPQGWAWLEGEEDKGDEDWDERLQELFASLPTIAASRRGDGRWRRRRRRRRVCADGRG